MSAGVRFSAVSEWLPQLAKRKHGSWVLRVAGSQGFSLETRRPFPKFVEQRDMQAMRDEYRQLIASLDRGRVFQADPAGATP